MTDLTFRFLRPFGSKRQIDNFTEQSDKAERLLLVVTNRDECFTTIYRNKSVTDN